MEALLLTVLGICIVGFIVWLAITYIPMPPLFRTLVIGVVAIVVIYWLITHYAHLLK